MRHNERALQILALLLAVCGSMLLCALALDLAGHPPEVLRSVLFLGRDGSAVRLPLGEDADADADRAPRWSFSRPENALSRWWE
jgi:hypothetical protein